MAGDAGNGGTGDCEGEADEGGAFGIEGAGEAANWVLCVSSLKQKLDHFDGVVITTTNSFEN